MSPNTIASKQEYYALAETLAFGNRIRSWPSLSSLRDTGYDGRIVMRYKGVCGGGRVAYHLTLSEAIAETARWRDAGLDPARIGYNESAPDDQLIAQGEVAWVPEMGGWYLRYSQAKVPMRAAMQQAQTLYGLAVLLALEHWLSPSSYDDLRLLLDLYPNSVVEFGVYSCDLGILPGRNCVIWEARNY